MDSVGPYGYDPMALSDDGDALVAELLSQFNAGIEQQGHTNAERAQSVAVSGLVSSDRPVEVPRQSFANHAETMEETPAETEHSRNKMVTVEVPKIANPEDYHFLPGHFTVRHVIREIRTPSDETLYQVRLASGEEETVSLAFLTTLHNGLRALENFQSSSDEIAGTEISGGRRLRRRVSRPQLQLLDEESSSDSQGPQARNTRRVARNTKRNSIYLDTLSSDEDGGSMSSDNGDIKYETTAPRRRGLRQRVARQAQRRSQRYAILVPDSEEEENIERRASRHSKRKRKSLRHNLRERLEDEISENEAQSSERFVGAKEVFRKIPVDDTFRTRHCGSCEVCSIAGDDYVKGPLVFCQGCTSAYHQACLGPRTTREHLVTKIGDETFVLQCRRCVGSACSKDPVCPHQGYCTGCKEPGSMAEPLRERVTARQEQQLRQNNGGKDPITAVDMDRVNNLENILFRCGTCHRAFHFEHLPPMSDKMDSPENSADHRFQEYSRTWQCQDCSTAPGEIQAMVAWRPVDCLEYIPRNTTAESMKEDRKEYLIKWKTKSYFHTTWMPGSWVWGIGSVHMRRAFFRSPKNLTPHMTTEEAIPEEFLRVDIVFDVRYLSDNDDDADDSNDDDGDELLEDTHLRHASKVKEAYVKFKGLPYEESAWESPPDPSDTERWADFMKAYQDWVARDLVHVPKKEALQKRLTEARRKNFKSALVKESQPSIMTGGTIMEYQKDGLNWLYYMWYKQQNAILADEMGLGKTIQVIGLLSTLIQDHECWPFLVVVPNSTCPNWRREIKSWAPSLRVVTYYGSAYARQLAQDHELFANGTRDLRCHIVVTSYETMIDLSSRKLLSRIPWAGLIVDEGQRLKNDKSQLYESLSRMKFPYKVLLTGTPLQNNIRELLNLLQFCDPTKDAETLEQEYGALSKENITALHDMIRPFFLRRTKAQVLTFLPPMVQVILPVSMSILQKRLYKSILAKNPELIKAIFQRHDDQLKQNERQNLNNILMQLRKCLCHPFVYSQAIEERTANTKESHKHLVEASGKLKLLELMLPKLHQRGHRVLIFSQFLDNLDIVEDFLDGLGLMHRRLDGRMNSLEKQKQIDAYNAEGSPYFAFLLSTRSGGVGINLATADTVIIMDPDFNPHQDMQALSRAHRIGQKNKVLVFQLMTRGSAEEKIMQIGKKKMVLDHVLIERMDADDDDGQDLESILRHGAQALFDDDDSGDVTYDAESVDRLLDRSQAEQAASPEGPADTQFSFARVWANDDNSFEDRLQDPDMDRDTPNSTVWEKILQERELAAAEDAKRRAETFGRGKRKRMTIDYNIHDQGDAVDESPVKPRREADSDAEFHSDGGAPQSETESDAPELDPEDLLRSPAKPKVRTFHRVDPLPLPHPKPPTPMSLDGHVDQLTCLACGGDHPPGSCLLRLAGVEHCGLCGIAHMGQGRACPHLKEDVQVQRMLEALKESPEPRELVEKAKKYLQGIRGDLAQRKRKEALKANPSAVAPPLTTPRRGRPPLKNREQANINTTRTPTVDLTGL
ncbi:hypothetical protein ASPZODRAFT_129654 [Penicilliopsis zonata CBS 506.65]|uniref:Chromatin remodeling complex subunit n=1 Tax=Penicilliopsis zonata CBS 506.65 TaxID=1073090 RepID=A0A1L9SQ70_9EURO|nr:hypothetical protein ASPZODRAFT_129654 [Penicilliopsis zonata CBS 506.65]OJJ49241.1 hypothetical protein ASPZODRAFT_129654 [Penicilliopsis zonata CBS 506.65]